jgi:tetratricopeptide (TPR) repeat protein
MAMRHVTCWAITCAVYFPLASGCATLQQNGWLPGGSQARLESGRGTPEDYARLAEKQSEQPVMAPDMGIEAPQPSLWDRFTATITAPFRSEPELPAADKPAPGDAVALSTPLPKPTAELYLSTGRVHETSGRIDLAIEQYRKALQVEPYHLEATLSLAHLYDRQGKFAEATKLYQQATQRDPNRAAAFNDLGLCHFRQGQYGPALGALTRAVELQPTRKLYRNNLATLLVEMDRPEEALAHLKAVHPPAVAHYNLGYLHSQAGQREQAVAQFRLALAEDPEFAAAGQWMAALTSGAPAATEVSEADVAHVAAPARQRAAVRRTPPPETTVADPMELDEASDDWTDGLPEITLPGLHAGDRGQATAAPQATRSPSSAGSAPPTRY